MEVHLDCGSTRNSSAATAANNNEDESDGDDDVKMSVERKDKCYSEEEGLY